VEGVEAVLDEVLGGAEVELRVELMNKSAVGQRSKETNTESYTAAETRGGEKDPGVS